ncbi:MAG: radical SAM protein [Deltaproteobacteria bacterium]
MKSSFYNLFINSEDQNSIVLFNTLYGSMTSFTTQEIDIVREMLDNPNKYFDENKIIYETLISQKFLIEDNFDEMGIIKNRKLKGIADKNRLDVIIMPTQDCNFNCIYCYEEHKKSKMDNETLVGLKKWLSIELPKFKVVYFSFFGGEPLLYYKKLIELLQFIEDIEVKNKIIIVKHITTNGYLLSKSKIKSLVELGVKDFQITVDGTANTHNKMRPLKNGKASFEKVHQNIILLAEENNEVKVTIRINFNHTNFHTIPDLLKSFPEKLRSQLRISLEPVFGDCEYNALDNIGSEELGLFFSRYLELAEQSGFNSISGKNIVRTGKLVYCYAERENQYIINYNGDVFKCSVHNFESLNRKGFIKSDGSFVKDEMKWNEWMNLSLFEEFCLECKYIPLCMGGCRKKRLNIGGKMSSCALIPTNANYVLKLIAFNFFKKAF